MGKLVDAALVGFDRREPVTIPPLPDAAQWSEFNAARQAMLPNFAQTEPAAIEPPHDRTKTSEPALRLAHFGETMKKQSGRVAVVTGASSDIGKATTEALVRAGFTVFGTSRRAIDNGPKQVTMLVCDVTDDASVNELITEVLSRAAGSIFW